MLFSHDFHSRVNDAIDGFLIRRVGQLARPMQIRYVSGLRAWSYGNAQKP